MSMSKSKMVTVNRKRRLGHARLAAMSVSAAAALIASTSRSHAATSINPIAGATGWNQDLFAEPGNANTSSTTTAAIDPANNWAFFVNGLVNGGAGGVPASSATTPFTSLANTNTSFQFQPFGTGTGTVSNTIYLRPTAINSGQQSTGTLSFSANPYTTLSLLTNGGNGASLVNYTINYADGTKQTGSYTAPDWFNGTGTAIYAQGRVNRVASVATGNFDNNSGTANNPRFYEVDLTPSKPLVAITGITFADAGTSASSAVGIYGISGATSTALLYTGQTGNGLVDTTSLNFQNSAGSNTAFTNVGSYVTFDDTPLSVNGGEPTNLTVVGTLTPALLTFNNSNAFYSLTGGAINGSGGVNVTGGGLVQFSSLNNYTGTTNVSNGVLNVASTGTIGTGAIIVGDNGQIKFNDAAQTVASLNGTGSIIISANTTLTVNGSGTFTGSLGGAGNLVFTNTQILNGANFYAGNTAFNTGSNVTTNNGGAFGAGTLLFNGGGFSASAPLTVANVNGSNAVTNNFNIASGVTATFGGAFPIDLTGNGLLVGTTGTITVSTAGTVVNAQGTIGINAATGVLTKAGVGTLQLSNTSNGFTALNISAGVLAFLPGTLGANGIPLNLNGGTLQYLPGNTEDVSTTHVLSIQTSGGTIDTNGNTVTFAGNILNASTGTFTKTGSGNLIMQTSLHTVSATVMGGTSAAPSIWTFNGPSATLTQSSTGAGLSIGEQTGDYGILNVLNGATVTVVGGGINVADQASAVSTISNNDTGIINLGAGSTIQSSGPVAVGKGNGSNNASFGVVNETGGTFNITNGATLQLASNNFSVGAYNLSGGVLYANAVTLTGNAGGNGTFNLSGGTFNALSIAGGPGTSNLYFNGGTVNATNASTAFISAITNAKIFAGGFNLTTTNLSTGVNNNFSETIPANITTGLTGTADGGLTFNGGSGTLTLSGTDSYTGPTVVSGNLTFSQSGTTTLVGNITTNVSTGTLTQSGAGTTILSGTDSAPGGVFISKGALQLQPTAVLNTPSVVLTGGALGISSDSTLGTLAINNSGGAIQFNNYTSNLSSGQLSSNGIERIGAANGSASTLAGSISGPITLVYVGPGTLNLTGTNNYSNGTQVSAGYLNFASGGLGTGPVSLLGGVVQYASGNTQDLTTQGLTLGAGGGGIDTGANNVTYAGNITGTNLGNFTKYGTGTLTLQGSVAPTTLFVRAGTLSLVGTSSNVSSNSFVSVGLSSGDNGTLSMDQGAKLTTTAGFNLGDQAGTVAAPNMGTLNIADTTSAGTTLTAASVFVGKGANGATAATNVGVVNQTGGLVQLSNTSSGTFAVGVYGAGTYNQTGGNVVAGAVNIAQNTGSTGVYNLGGTGTLTATQVLGGAGTSSVLNFNGGTLKANGSSTSFVTGLTSANVLAGGAKINTNGFNVSLVNPLVTGVTGGTDGGLTKTGAGTLTVNSASTFTGGTNISQGTVSMNSPSSLGSGPITLGNGTVLAVTTPISQSFSGFNGFVKNNNGQAGALPTLTATTAQLTDFNGHEASSVYSPVPVTINDGGSFTASFTYNHTQVGGSFVGADGITFLVQNQSIGALGGSGGSYGYKLGGAAPDTAGTAITNSGAIYLDEYNNYVGTGANGTVTAFQNYFPSLSAQASTNVIVTYNGATKLLTASFNNPSGTTTTSETIDLASTLGGTAGGFGNGYVGFTGATGGVTDTQTISNFTFTNSLPSANISNAIIVAPGASATLQQSISTAGANGSIGALTFGSGSTLNVVPVGVTAGGYSLTTGAVTLSGTDTLDGAANSNSGSGTIYLGALSDGGVTSTLAVQDADTVVLTAAGSLASSSTVTVAGGSKVVLASPTALGAASIVDNGTVLLGAGTGITSVNFGGPYANNIVLNGNSLVLSPASNFAVTGVISDGTPAGGSVNVSSGTVTFAGNETYTGLTSVGTGATLNVNGSLAPTGAVTTSGTVNFAANTSGGIYVRTKGLITINTGGVINIGLSTPATSRTLFVASGLVNAGKLNVGNNDLDIQNGSLSTITSQIASGYANGTWQGSAGITSLAAANDSSHLTALGVILNTVDGTTPIYGTGTALGLFDGVSPAATDVLVKYTYYGDATLDGRVDGSDYTRIDNGYLSGLSGWFNGDFNYDGVVDGSDYTLIDNAFNTQGAQISAELASPTAEIAGGASSAVPEPTSIGLIGLAAAGLLGRRRRVSK